MENIQSSSKPSLNKEFYLDLLELSDGKLHTEDGCSFNIHKIELVKNSNYFYRLFCGAIGKGRNEYFIPGIRGEVLGNILSFIYAGKVDISEANVCELLIAADYLLLDDLIMDIRNIYIRDNLSVRNCLYLFLAAFKIERNDILAESFRFIQTHFEAVVAKEGSDIGQLPLDVLKTFLSDKNLCIEDENSVWIAIYKWIEADIPRRQSLLPDLLKYLAVSDIDEELATRILEHNIVTSSPICEEINTMKRYSTLQSNIEILVNYIRKQPSSLLVSLNHRQPSQLYFIAHYCVHNQSDGIHIYTTYDEKIDLWRKIVEVEVCPDYVLSIGHNIYMFATSESRNTCYNLIGREWSILPRFRVPRNYYAVVQLDGLIYVLGGISVRSEDEMNEVEVYDRVEGAWHDVSPMMPATSFIAVTLGRRIYVVGNSPYFLSSDMIAQMYDVESDIWVFIASPSIFRFNFALVAYRDRLYVIGGRNEDDYLKSVEVFDPEKREWETHKQLPYTFYLPKAVVLNDDLIVYDNHLEDRSYLRTNPALKWDRKKEYWKPFEESSPMNTIHKYCFFTPDDIECTKRISRENKDPQTKFYRSPFRLLL